MDYRKLDPALASALARLATRPPGPDPGTVGPASGSGPAPGTGAPSPGPDPGAAGPGPGPVAVRGRAGGGASGGDAQAGGERSLGDVAGPRLAVFVHLNPDVADDELAALAGLGLGPGSRQGAVATADLSPEQVSLLSDQRAVRQIRLSGPLDLLGDR